MSEETVTVSFDDKASDNAVLLLAAAEELGYDPSIVQTTEGGFRVPKDVHDKAFGKDKPKDEWHEHDKASPPKSGRKKKSESEEG